MKSYASLGVRCLLVLIRLYLGAWMLLNGLNHFVEIFPQSMGGSLKSSQMMVTLIETGLFDLVKVAEIVIGIFLLFDWFVPVALVMSMPISTIVWYNNAILNGRTFEIRMGNNCLVFTIILLLAYLPHFLPMMRFSTEMGKLADLKRLGEIFVRPVCVQPESGHRVTIFIAGLLLSAYLAWELHPKTEQPAGTGKTPAAIVTEYMNLAYGQGKRAEAEKLYFSDEARDGEKDIGLPKEGQRVEDKVLNVIAQGQSVAVHHRIVDPQGMSLEIVDLYRTNRSQIVEHAKVSQGSVQ